MRRTGLIALTGALALVPCIAAACGDDGASIGTLPPIVTTTTTTTTIAPTTTIQATYTVEPNDTLFKIAAKFGLTMDAILAANPKITNPDKIDSGTVIKLPQPGDPAPSTSTPAPASSAATAAATSAPTR